MRKINLSRAKDKMKTKQAVCGLWVLNYMFNQSENENGFLRTPSVDMMLADALSGLNSTIFRSENLILFACWETSRDCLHLRLYESRR